MENVGDIDSLERQIKDLERQEETLDELKRVAEEAFEREDYNVSKSLGRIDEQIERAGGDLEELENIRERDELLHLMQRELINDRDEFEANVSKKKDEIYSRLEQINDKIAEVLNKKKNEE